MAQLEPALGALLDAAAATGEIRADVSADDLLYAVASCASPCAATGPTTAGAWSPC